MSSSPSTTHDVLVVGGGPAGAAAGYWLAKAGHDVAIVERKQFPREKTCGDGLTPRAVSQLTDMGLLDRLDQDHHRYKGLRATGFGMSLELEWPSHPVYPSYGYVVRRRELDQMVAENAVKMGATLHQSTEAMAPRLERGLVRGATVKDKETGLTRDIRARFVVVADGANSRFGRALGCSRTKAWPQGMAIRSYWESPLHAEPWIESALDVRDRNGNTLPGYGWIFPVGDGTVNVGVGLLSTFRDYRDVNTTHLLSEYAATAPKYWELDADNPVCPATGGRLPMGGSVGPKVGPTYLVVGDAAGMVNPFNGEGIDYAYETARMAASVLGDALSSNDPMALHQYSKLLEDEYGRYHKVARLFAKVIGQPALMSQLTRIGLHSRTLMEWVLRILANILRPDEIGPAEAAYKMAAAICRFVPES
jgi:geranylgeranyl reductase family protein